MAKPATDAAAAGWKPAVLLADDDVEYLHAASTVLRDADFDVTAVADGHHANLALEVAALTKHPFDLLVLDIRMPGATGWEVLRAARERVQPGVLPPRVLLMTGFTMELDLDRVRAERADGVLLKPFTNTALVAECRRVLAIHRPAPEAIGDVRN